MNNISDLSVVIATLGGPILKNTLDSINSGTLIPREILICIPAELSSNIKHLNHNNVTILNTPFRGQVGQRAFGLKQAQYDLVLQLDDDIHLMNDTLFEMVNAIRKLGKLNVVGPILINKNSKIGIFIFSKGIKGFILSLYSYLFEALPFGTKRMGRLSSICCCSNIDSKLFSGPNIKTDWLAGGCVLSHKSDLVLENFYPYKGKAYAEDCLHSFLRTNRGISHYVILTASAAIDVPAVSFSFKQYFLEMRARLYITRIMQGSLFRGLILAIVECLRRLIALRKFSL